jgi:UDP-glucose 4-epimerase
MNVLVLGGAGYIGSHMVKMLLARGHEVTVFDNLVTGFRDALKGGRLVEGDLLDYDALHGAMKGARFDGVIHFASAIQVGESMRDPLKYYANNVTGTVNLLRACVATGTPNVVFSSSAAVYGQLSAEVLTEAHPPEPINPYGRTKHICEDMLKDCATAHGLQSVSLRYFNAAGADPDGELGERHEPETHLIPLLLQAASGRRSGFTVNGRDFATPDGTCVRDYVHVTDLCDAHLKALEYLRAGGKCTSINLGSGVGFSVLQVIEAAKRVTGIDFSVQWGPRREGDPPRLVAGRDKAKAVLGWEPKYSDLDTIIRHAWAWERKVAA